MNCKIEAFVISLLIAIRMLVGIIIMSFGAILILNAYFSYGSGFGLGVLFFIIGFGSLVPLVINIRSVMKTKKGDIISGTVRGYAKTATYINGECVLRIKVLIDRDTEPKIVIFNTGETTRMYPINTEIKLRRYENYFSIVE